jgi:heme oxygenase
MDLPRSLASIAEYSALLVRLRSVHAAYENALGLFDWTATGIDFASRRRARWLEEDISITAPGYILERTHCYHVGTFEEAVGILYVLEGSSLGGQVMLRQATLLPGISAIAGARFFAGHGDRTAQMWNDFVAILNRLAGEDSASAAIELGALEAFAKFTAALSAGSLREAVPTCTDPAQQHLSARDLSQTATLTRLKWVSATDE